MKTIHRIWYLILALTCIIVVLNFVKYINNWWLCLIPISLYIAFIIICIAIIIIIEKLKK